MKWTNYLFYCHRRPDRSFFFRGKQFPICARCTGITLGYVLGLAPIIAGMRIPYPWLVILLLPATVDGGVQLFGRWESTNIRRLITGIMMGIGIVCLIWFFGYDSFQLGQSLGSLILERQAQM